MRAVISGTAFLKTISLWPILERFLFFYIYMFGPVGRLLTLVIGIERS